MKFVFPGLVVLSLVAGAAPFVLLEPQPAEHEVTNRPNQVVEADFTSSNSCRACHPAQYATWHASYHRTMTQVASPVTVVADFDNVADWRLFREHPAHLLFMEEHITGKFQDRAAIQYQTPADRDPYELSHARMQEFLAEIDELG